MTIENDIKDRVVSVSGDQVRLGIEAAASLLTLLIVTVRDRVEDISVNLQGPLVVSSRSRVGIQLVLEEFPLRHPPVLPARR